MLCGSVAKSPRDAALVGIANDALYSSVAVLVAKNAESKRQSNEHAKKCSVAAFVATCAHCRGGYRKQSFDLTGSDLARTLHRNIAS